MSVRIVITDDATGEEIPVGARYYELEMRLALGPSKVPIFKKMHYIDVTNVTKAIYDYCDHVLREVTVKEMIA